MNWLLEEKTHRFFFSPHRRRCVRVINERPVFESSQEQPALVEVLQAPQGRVLRMRTENGSLWTRQYRLQRKYGVIARHELGEVPARVALSDDGGSVLLSYWRDYREGAIDRYEVRRWPGLELTADMPVSDLMQAGDAVGPLNSRGTLLDREGPLSISSCGLVFAAASVCALQGFLAVHLVGLQGTHGSLDLPSYGPTRMLEGSRVSNANLGAMVFSHDGKRLAAIFVPNTWLLERDWFPWGPPAWRSFEAEIRPDDTWVKGWGTGTRTLVDAEDLRDELFEVMKEEVRCPTILRKAPPLIPRLIDAGLIPSPLERLWRGWMRFRLGRQSARLSRLLGPPRSGCL
jgi:hypothetical protein